MTSSAIRRVAVVRRCLHASCPGRLQPWRRAAVAITGVVRDTSGGVLPGVTVEAASPALIEKVRAASPTAKGSTASSICGPATTP